MKTPTYWDKKNLVSCALYPTGKLYGWLTSLRIKFVQPNSVDKPVICVGNLTAGGTGKTPVSISFSNLLKELNYNPFFVSRGYGGKLKDIMVDPKHHTSQETGDEPLLLAQHAPVVINSDRYKAAQKAINNGADIIIMDDGFQNPSLKKDLSFLVFDGIYGIGNGWCIPAGPLREEFSAGIKRADAIIIIGNDQQNIAKKTNLPCFMAKISPIKQNYQNKNIIAFAGIGRPEKFYTSLRDLDFNLLKTHDFPDHHKYTKEELENLIEFANLQNADIFTTSKDFVKIPAGLRKHFKVLEIEIKWDDENSLVKFITSKLTK